MSLHRGHTIESRERTSRGPSPAHGQLRKMSFNPVSDWTPELRKAAHAQDEDKAIKQTSTPQRIRAFPS